MISDAKYVKAATVVSSKPYRLTIVAESSTSAVDVLPEGVDNAELKQIEED